ncbi:hypothetical protein FG386_002487 [Cryptosporidium ryanae]|uniref:uncharacterized protein n=1 Tax=Cryptosporidium ryanae TaxID=515981 RepID=UPI00351A1DE5|nr:hypothetical protein FG386_002487 [Cryptosporidium ryanae]
MTSLFGVSPASSKALVSISKIKTPRIGIDNRKLLINKINLSKISNLSDFSNHNTPLTLSSFQTPINVGRNKEQGNNTNTEFSIPKISSINAKNRNCLTNTNDSSSKSNFSLSYSHLESHKGDEKDNIEYNEKIVNLLEKKKSQIKTNIETLTIQLKKNIRQIDYINLKIKELKSEFNSEVESECTNNSSTTDYFKNFNSDFDVFNQLNSNKVFCNMNTSTDISTCINSPNNELSNSNEFFEGNLKNNIAMTYNLQTPKIKNNLYNVIEGNSIFINDNEWVLLPEFKDIACRCNLSL